MECDIAETNDLQIWIQRPSKNIIALLSGCFDECSKFRHFIEVWNEIQYHKRVKERNNTDLTLENDEVKIYF